MPNQKRGRITLELRAAFALIALTVGGCASSAYELTDVAHAPGTSLSPALAPTEALPAKTETAPDALAQPQATGDAETASAPPQADAEKRDDTGTNPVNFTYEFRLSTEMAELPSPGGSQVTNAVEVRAPFGRDIANLGGKGPGNPYYDMGSTTAVRFRARTQDLSINDPTATPFGTQEVSGIGDFDARILHLPYMSKDLIVAAGVEAFFDTASSKALGAGTTRIGPQIFTAFPGKIGKGSLFVPGYQYVFDVAGSGPSVSTSQIDLYFVWRLAGGKNWLLVDPQIVLDHENSKEAMTFEAEWGYMMVPKSGISAYLRPGFGIGTAKPYSWNFEIGLKFIWR